MYKTFQHLRQYFVGNIVFIHEHFVFLGKHILKELLLGSYFSLSCQDCPSQKIIHLSMEGWKEKKSIFNCFVDWLENSKSCCDAEDPVSLQRLASFPKWEQSCQMLVVFQGLHSYRFGSIWSSVGMCQVELKPEDFPRKSLNQTQIKHWISNTPIEEFHYTIQMQI